MVNSNVNFLKDIHEYDNFFSIGWMSTLRPDGDSLDTKGYVLTTTLYSTIPTNITVIYQ